MISFKYPALLDRQMVTTCCAKDLVNRGGIGWLEACDGEVSQTHLNGSASVRGLIKPSVAVLRLFRCRSRQDGEEKLNAIA